MSVREFSLKPFSAADIPDDLKITGSISRLANTLEVNYALSGSLNEIVVPVISQVPARKNSLWEETCFELFLGLKNSGRYWELNLSPSGHWNVYRFNSYRQGMEEEASVISLPFNIQRKPDVLRFSLEFNLDNIIPAGQSLNVGICAVIKFISGKTTYWALTHPGERPDFHREENFIIEL